MKRDEERAGRRDHGREDLHDSREDLRDEDELRAEDRGAYTAHYGDSSGEHPGEVGRGMRMGDTQTGEFRGHGREQEGLNQTGRDLEDEDEELVEEDVRREEVDIEDQTHGLEEGRSTESRREEQTAETTEQPGRQAQTEQTGKEDFIDKAKRKLQGR